MYFLIDFTRLLNALRTGTNWRKMKDKIPNTSAHKNVDLDSCAKIFKFNKIILLFRKINTPIFFL